MADRVRFMTRNDTGTPANSSGCNGFPFPSTYTAGPTSDHPKLVAYTDCIKWYWRVKSWLFDSDLVITDGTTSYSINAIDLSGSVAATTELDLIYGGGYSQTYSGASPDLLAGSVDVILDVIDDGGDFYPFVTLNLGTGTGHFQFNLDSSLLSSVTGTTSFLLDGYSLTLYYRLDTGFTLSGTQASLTPIAFWPYAAADATPIYNTTTGAQLQSPLN